ncbi:hypothetical protein MTO96_020822 [Rhipicephalus appendiculatus]
MEVVRAAEQLVSPALAAAATSVTPPATSVPASEQKTTTVIMTKNVSSLPPEPSRPSKPSKLSLGPKPVPPPKPKKLQGLVTEPESLTFIEKKHHFESMQQQQGSLHKAAGGAGEQA